MKVAKRHRRRSKAELDQNCFSLSSAKTYLGRLLEKASRGEQVWIVRGQQRFIVQEIPPIDPIVIRPSGYFANCYTREEIQEQNQLAKHSVTRPPHDLE
jgi:hypothetical protein